MKKILFCLSLFIIFLSCRSQNEVNEEYLLYRTVRDTLSQHHFLQKNQNTDFYQKVFSNFIYRIDSNKFLFSQQEITSLKKLSNPTLVDNDNQHMVYLETIGQLPEKAFSILNDKLASYEELLNKVYAKPIDFLRNQTYEVDGEKKKYLKSDEEVFARWERFLDYVVLNRLLIATDIAKASTNITSTNITSTNITSTNITSTNITSTNITSTVLLGGSVKYGTEAYKEKEKVAREESLKNMQRFMVTLKTRTVRDYFNYYLQSIGAAYDQYTDYQSPVEQESFNINLSGKLEGIGAHINKDGDGSILVVNVVVGGPSYKQKALSSGDKILKVAQVNDGEVGEFVDLIPVSLNKALSYIRGKDGSVVKLLVRRTSGKVEEVSIVRGEIILEDAYAQSAVLESEGEKYGYINIPRFYGDPRGRGGRTVSGDVLKFLQDFKKSDIKSLIVDLRYNGGGFLSEALRLSSFFIGPQPVVRVRNRWEERVLNGTDGQVFDKPLLVMINGNSASASEIFAAAMQDYERALIVGSEQSFGKATVQTLLNLNGTSYLQSIGKPFGGLKYTIQKYYRVTGKSTQTKGVRSDIVLPGLDLSSKIRKHSFPIDELNPLQVEVFKNVKYYLVDLMKNSDERIRKDSFFANSKKRYELIEKNFKNTLYTLNYEIERKKRDQYLKSLDEFKLPDVVKAKSYKVSRINSLYKKGVKGDELKVQQDKKKQWKDSLEKDVYLKETLNILKEVK